MHRVIVDEVRAASVRGAAAVEFVALIRARIDDGIVLEKIDALPQDDTVGRLVRMHGMRAAKNGLRALASAQIER